MFKMHRRL